MNDPVNHPAHYTTGKIEVIEFVEDQKFGYHLGNVVKYISRSKHKCTELQDLAKARWYLDRYIQLREKQLVEQCHSEQSRAAQDFISSACRGASIGINDWVAEEVLIGNAVGRNAANSAAK